MIRKPIDLDQLAALSAHRLALLKELDDVESVMRPMVVRGVRSGTLSQRKAQSLTQLSKNTVRAWVRRSGSADLVESTLVPRTK